MGTFKDQQLNLIILLALVFVLSSCSIADVRPKALRNGAPTETMATKGTRILQMAVWRQDKSGQWDRFDQWEVVARDVWYSSLIRRLTPIPQNDQKLKFIFALKSNDIEMEYIEGKLAGQILGEDVPASQKRLYLEPVRDYFFWPQSLVNSKNIVYAGESRINDQDYIKIFASNGPTAPVPEYDQYLVWIRKDTLQIEFIEFTLRDMLKSYKGVVHYQDYRQVEDMMLPYRISLKDKITDERSSHEFFVDDMSFTKERSPLTFRIKIQPLESLM